MIIRTDSELLDYIVGVMEHEKDMTIGPFWQPSGASQIDDQGYATAFYTRNEIGWREAGCDYQIRAIQSSHQGNVTANIVYYKDSKVVNRQVVLDSLSRMRLNCIGISWMHDVPFNELQNAYSLYLNERLPQINSEHSNFTEEEKL